MSLITSIIEFSNNIAKNSYEGALLEIKVNSSLYNYLWLEVASNIQYTSEGYDHAKSSDLLEGGEKHIKAYLNPKKPGHFIINTYNGPVKIVPL